MILILTEGSIKRTENLELRWETCGWGEIVDLFNAMDPPNMLNDLIFYHL